MIHRSRASRGLAGLALALLALTLGAAEESRADIIFLKDGFVLQGKVRREGTTEIDSVTRESAFIPKGLFTLDDGPRRILFSPRQVRIVERMPPPPDERITWKARLPIVRPGIMPAILEVVETTDWDKNWERKYWFRSPNSERVGLRQGIGLLTPYYVRADAATKFFWSCAYLTRELSPDTIKALLDSHPALQDKGPKLKPEMLVARRMRKVDFYAQAGLFDLAEKELDRLVKDYPGQQKRAQASRRSLNRVRARERLEEIKRWRVAGRHDDVRTALERFPERNAPEAVQAKVRELRSKYKRTDEQVKQTARHLALVAKRGQAKAPTLAAAALVIKDELAFDNVGRLEAFLSQALQVKRQQDRKVKRSYTSAQLLSLAVTGWLLGSSSAEARPESAEALWKARGLVLDYCRGEDSATRRQALASLGKISPKVEVDEIAQFIPHLPPVDPEPNINTRTVAVNLGPGRRGITYHRKLPPEYTHNRPYPVLIVLHRSGQRPTAMLDRWADAAAENGFILAAPEWEGGVASGYHYSEEEHQVVLRTIHDLRRRFRVDSDRIFLFGLEEGGKMAWDVGLSHPDLFAGVMPMSAGPMLFPGAYWRNAQYLPIYAVSGTRTGETQKQVKSRFDEWAVRGYPALWIDYKNRGHEWFGGEVPNMFDWMHRQRRTFPLRQLGTEGFGGPFGNEFCSMRASDNRFYWLSTDSISSRNTNSAERWSYKVIPAMMAARVDGDQNAIYITASGMRKLTVWIGRDAKGTYLLDLDKPLSITGNLKRFVHKKHLTPSLSVLLQDLYERGDRQHLFVTKVEIDLLAR
jgi:predicted esterase